MENYDVKKDHRDLYAPREGRLSVVEVPPLRFLMVDGAGDPNTSPDYRVVVETLFACSYAVRKACIEKLGRKHTVGPLEGLWSAGDMTAFHTREKAEWKWTMMIVQPTWVTAELAATAVETATSTTSLAAGARVRFAEFVEGPAVQTLYVGPYDEEGPAIARLHEYVTDEGWALTGRHHEIYLSDVRRTEPARLRTILRQPFAR